MLAQLVLAALTVHPELWPAVERAVPLDAKTEKAIDAILGKMSLEEKVGQILQPSIHTATPADVRKYHLGSVLNGGGGWPGDIRKATPKDWLALADALHEASMDTSDGGQAIPIIWGADAVHGHNNIIGATLFPHNIGLGAARNPELIRRIGEITATEMAVTGIDWNFSPTVAVARDDRWGRTYESWSEDPEIVRAYAAKMVEGLQGAPRARNFLGRGKVIATAKHFIGDGGTDGGRDQGNTLASETELRDIHGAGYVGALGAGVQAVMASYNSWHGQKMHGNRALLTDVLKGRMRFDGIVVGDWNGHGQIPGCSNSSCPDAINAGIDMFMVPEDWKALYENTLAQVREGKIAMARLDDAVRRILRVKMRASLFTAGKPSQRRPGGEFARIGSAEHRAVARQAVRESLVLLKNNRALLPLKPRANVLVAGDGADNIAKQCGGWTISWQGDQNSNEHFPGATSIWAGIRATVEAAGGKATLSPDGSFTEKPDVAIVVYGENPYAEFEGDRRTIVFSGAAELAMLERFAEAGVPVVSVFLSGRPLWVNRHLNASDAFIAAWLPGTEGGGIADVLFRSREDVIAHDFRGKLSFSWPKDPAQERLNRGDAQYDPLFAYGHGLTYRDQADVPPLPQDFPRVFFDDFHYTAPADMARHGWIIRTELGWPGIPGATWGPDRITLHDDPDRPDNRLLRMTSATDGVTTQQSQFCHERKYREGTYAARVRFTDQPVSGPGGDQIVETFYMISPLKVPMDVDYSEIDFEYLPNGGWGHTGPTLFGTTWETFSPEPNWIADNASGNQSGSREGWHTLVAQVGSNQVRYFVDGKELATHDERVYPESMMSINFNLWFIKGGLIDSREARRYVEDVDWVFHRADTVLSAAEVERAVEDFRRGGVKFRDHVPAANPPLPSPCNF